MGLFPTAWLGVGEITFNVLVYYLVAICNNTFILILVDTWGVRELGVGVASFGGQGSWGRLLRFCLLSESFCGRLGHVNVYIH